MFFILTFFLPYIYFFLLCEIARFQESLFVPKLFIIIKKCLKYENEKNITNINQLLFIIPSLNFKGQLHNFLLIGQNFMFDKGF